MAKDWRNNLESFLETAERRKREKSSYNMSDFMQGVVTPAFEELTRELAKYGRDVTIRHTEASASLTVQMGGNEEIRYRILGRPFPTGIRPYAQIRCRERNGLRLITVESMIRSGTQDYTIEDISKDEIIQNFLDNYIRRVKSPETD